MSGMHGLCGGRRNIHLSPVAGLAQNRVKQLDEVSLG